MMIHFVVLGEPVAQARARATVIGGHVRMYDPSKSSDFKQYIKLVASEHKPEQPLTGPISLSARFYRSIPKSFSKKKQEAAVRGELRPISKPDLDNYIKSAKDALKGIMWVDDSQVVDYDGSGKWYSHNPRIEIVIRALPNYETEGRKTK